MILITICDIPATKHYKDKVEQSGGKIVRINDGDQERYGVMDVQFEISIVTLNKVGSLKIETSDDVILFFKEEHGNFYVQYIDD